jgi:hypothetical protein
MRRLSDRAFSFSICAATRQRRPGIVYFLLPNNLGKKAFSAVHVSHIFLRVSFVEYVGDRTTIFDPLDTKI